MLLTDEEIEKCREKAAASYKRHYHGTRGQQVTEADDPEMHLIWAVIAAYEVKLREQNEPCHVLWKTGEVGVPSAILDRNGEVVLGLCKICGKGECDLVEPCKPHPAPIPEVKDAFPQARRLALELECLILSCKDTVAVSKWWDSANEALEQWREFNEAASSALELQDTDGGSRAGYECPVCRQCDCVGCKTPAARSGE